MAEKIQRQTQKIFGGNAPTDDLAVFGSFKANNPIYTDNLEDLQSPAYEEGWNAAIIANEAPFLEEMNGVQYGFSKQLAYLFQEGVPDYDPNTEYFTGGMAKGFNADNLPVLYRSLNDNNIGNPLSDTTHWQEWISGADIDLSNLSQTGIDKIKEYASSGGGLRQTQITNCLLEVPQRIKYTLVDGVLTVLKGSVVIVPYGIEDLTSQYPKGTTFINDNFKVYDTQFADGKFFVWAELVNDSVISKAGGTTSDNSIFLMNLETSMLTYCATSAALSGGDHTTASGYKYYETVTNTMYARGDSTQEFVKQAASLPVMTFERQEGTITSIKQVFNGFSYMGSTVWVDKGVKGLIPNGRNEDGTLNNTEFVTQGMITKTYSTTYKNYTLYIDKAGLYIVGNAKYNDELNYTVNSNGSYALTCAAGVVSATNGVISNFKPKQSFRAFDYNEISEISSYVIKTYINGTSGYRIWSDGYCEQWGKAALSVNSTNKINLLKTYANTNYLTFANGFTTSKQGDGGVDTFYSAPTSTSTFNITQDYTGDANVKTANWFVKGYLADGQY